VHSAHFFTVYEEGVTPANNAERALRTAVQRSNIVGTRSAEGERAVERVLTIVRTCTSNTSTPSRTCRP
jgi:hypothetical protein